MRRISAQLHEGVRPGVHRIVRPEQLATQWEPGIRFLVMITEEAEILLRERLLAAGLDNAWWVLANGLEPGDVVRAYPDRNELVVVYRESDQHHALFLTNRCNSYCLMCSQPPSRHDDSWLVNEALDVVRHIGASPRVLGITGGEPLLLGLGLRKVIDAIAGWHPKTRIEVLSNGRLFSQAETTQAILKNMVAPVSWLVPLYGHADFLHDFVVQARGAFEETLEGLLVLQEHRQAIQLRIVLIRPVLEVLPELCAFIGRNLPFVQEVALMACEPIGFALANREHCEVDLVEWHGSLLAATRTLERQRVPYLFMNTPLCALPPLLWPMAHRSISDWKTTYAADCTRCMVQDRCAGLFAWHERGWKPTRITPIEGAQA